MTNSTAAEIAESPVDGGVMVTIPSLDNSTRRHGPAIGYKPHPDGTEAIRGDRALVVEDNTGQLWLVNWQVA